MAEKIVHDAAPDDLRRSLEAVSTPAMLDTPLGTFELVDGVPTPQTVVKLYDALDFIRGVEVFLNMVPGASLVAMRSGFRSIGLTGTNQVGYTDPRANSGSYFLTPNTETTYGSMFFDLNATGPFVIEPPKQSLCVVDDFCFRYVTDMGIAGPDKGEGGKYLFLPPGYDGSVPDGYFVCRPLTFTNWVVLRALGGVPAIKGTRVYALADADNPPPTEFVNIADFHFNTVHANDFSFYEEVNMIVQEEPTTALDPERAGQLAGIGIAHGQPFAPDERRRATLDTAARAAAAISRALVYAPRDPEASHLRRLIVVEWLHRRQLRVPAPRRPPAGRSYCLPLLRHGHHTGDGSCPGRRWVGLRIHRSTTPTVTSSTGPSAYTLTLPADPPAKNFWSVDVYDTQTRSLLQTDNPYPSVMSLGDTVVANDDGSYTIWFGPQAPPGHERNWIQTLAGKGWFPVLRLYGPLQAWFDKTWKPGEIQRA